MVTPADTIEGKVIARGEYTPKGEWLVCVDPIYYPNDPMEAYIQIEAWECIHVFTVEDEHGIRALVITDGSAVPPELLNTELRGSHVKIHEVGVDSAKMCLAYEEPTGQAHSLSYDGMPPDSDGIIFEFDTYNGDGSYPVMAWGLDGRMFAFAVLMDERYYNTE